MTFSNADPANASANPLRVRRDKPHLWFQGGYWRVCRLPRVHGAFEQSLWARAHSYGIKLNTQLAFEEHFGCAARASA